MGDESLVGFAAPRLADLPVTVLVRMRSDRVLRRPCLARRWAVPAVPGGEFAFGDAARWGEPDITTRTEARLYGSALRPSTGPGVEPAASAVDPSHRLGGACREPADPGGTVIRLEVERLPSGAIQKPVWLWHSRTGLDQATVDHTWRAFLRRFDIEHTFRMLKQTLGWTTRNSVTRRRPTGGPGC